MFETEAGFAETKMLIKCKGDYSKKQDYKKGWQDGAEFGYNKANEWHYVKDELDTKSWKRYNKYLVIARFTTEVGNSDIPLLAHFDHYHQKWYVNGNYLSAFNVIAWKEIVLPKESK